MLFRSDESEDITKEKYQNLTEDELAMLMADESMEIVEQDTQTFPIVGPNGLQPIGPDGMPATYSIYAVTVQKKSKTGKVVIENVPPEEFLISKRAKDIQSSPFVAHRRLMTRSDLVAMGFSKKIVEGLPASDSLTYTPERLAQIGRAHV